VGVKIGDAMGGLTWEEHENLLAAIKKEGWQLRLLNVELRDGLVTGVVNLKIVRKELYEDYVKTYQPLEDGDYEKSFCTDLKYKKK
jgi:hypothetical protein